jgi:glycerophosphoryl diester phosphodiesterase
MENNEDQNIALAHAEEMIEAAAEQAKHIAATASRVMIDTFDYHHVDKNRTRSEIVSGYLLKEWTWLNTLESKIEAEEDIPAPEHCDHIDPKNPTVWIALLSKPNTLFCMECALEYANADIATGKELCDRCHETNDGEFYDFMMPIVNIQMMGAICKGCLDKV